MTNQPILWLKNFKKIPEKETDLEILRANPHATKAVKY
jgi:hypothetical protein